LYLQNHFLAAILLSFLFGILTGVFADLGAFFIQDWWEETRFQERHGAIVDFFTSRNAELERRAKEEYEDSVKRENEFYESEKRRLEREASGRGLRQSSLLHNALDQAKAEHEARLGQIVLRRDRTLTDLRQTMDSVKVQGGL